MRPTPDNLRLSLTALINGENLAYKTTFSQPRPLISAHVASCGTGDIDMYWVTFKPNQKEIEHLPAVRILVPVQDADLNLRPWHDIYVSLWEDHDQVKELFIKAFDETRSEYYYNPCEPDDLSHMAHHSADTVLAFAFPDTCPKTGHKRIVEREIQLSIDEARILEYAERRREEERRQKEQEEYNARLEQRQNDERIEKEYKELMERKEKENKNDGQATS